MSNTYEKITVCFTGLNLYSLPLAYYSNEESCILLKEKIKAEIIRLIEEENAVHFICAMEPGFDMLCAETLLELKKTYRHITLECSIPYETQAVNMSETCRDKYFYIIEMCDTETLQQTHYTANCIIKNYRRICSTADIVLALCADGQVKSGREAVFYLRKIS